MPKLNIIPSKHIYNALIQDIDTVKAISDLVDNAIDNHTVQEITNILQIEIILKGDNIQLTENSGGIDLETLPLLLMPGGTSRSGGKGIIGIWGVGAKRALFSLGNQIEIKTRKKGESGLILKVDKEWFQQDVDPDKWELEYEEDNSLEEGTTITTITDLKILIDSYAVSQLKNRLASTYRNNIAQGKLILILNDEVLTIGPDIHWARSEFAPPAKYETDIPVRNSDRVLHFVMEVGVMTQPGSDYLYGIDLIGNERTILTNDLTWRTGFDKSGLGFPHPTINRFKGVIKLEGDSRDIPWNSAKSDVSLNHPMYPLISHLGIKISRQYVQFLRKNYQHTSSLFRIRAEAGDIKYMPFEYNKGISTVVKDYREVKPEVTISFKVPQEDYIELVNYFNIASENRKNVGLFLFNRVLSREVRGLEED